jgi:hypothetical protein
VEIVELDVLELALGRAEELLHTLYMLVHLCVDAKRSLMVRLFVVPLSAYFTAMLPVLVFGL